MSVFVKGMKMPKECRVCRFTSKSEYCSCLLTGKFNFREYWNSKRLDDCPLVEVPEKHGRLFDESEVKKCLHELPDSEDKWNAIALLEWAIEKRWCIDAEDL